MPSLLQYVYGYRYNPSVANEFRYDLNIIRKNLTDETLLVSDHYDFYKILEASTNISVINELGEEKPYNLAVLYNMRSDDNYQLSRIIASPMRENSDIIYLYTEKGE